MSRVMSILNSNSKRRFKRMFKRKKVMFYKKISIIIIIIFSLELLYFFNNYDIDNGRTMFYIKEKALTKEFNTKIKSGNLSTDYEIDQVIKDINYMKLNTINIPIVINIQSLNSSDMNIDKYSLKKAENLINTLQGTNVSIILEPYPWIKDGSLSETKWKPQNIEDFFYNWKYKVLERIITTIGNPYNIDAINVASNLVCIEMYENQWCYVIKFVRDMYKGCVTYRTNWWCTSDEDEESYVNYQKKLNNKLFGEVDFISIAAYFELTDNNMSTVKDIVNSLSLSTVHNRNQNIKQQIYNFNKKWHKPIFFGELGFPKRIGAYSQPHNPKPSIIFNGSQQANGFKAYNKAFKDEDWLLGFSVFAIGEKFLDKTYYPSRKSIKVIQNWYD